MNTFTNTQIAEMQTPKHVAEALGMEIGADYPTKKSIANESWAYKQKAIKACFDGKGEEIFSITAKRSGNVKTSSAVKSGKVVGLMSSALSDDIKRNVSCAIAMLQLGDLSQSSIKAAFEGNGSAKLESMLLNVMDADSIQSAKDWAGVMTMAEKSYRLIEDAVTRNKVEEQAYLTLLHAGWGIDRPAENACFCAIERHLPLLKGLDADSLDDIRVQLSSGVMPLIITGEKFQMDELCMDNPRHFDMPIAVPAKIKKAMKTA